MYPQIEETREDIDKIIERVIQFKIRTEELAEEKDRLKKIRESQKGLSKRTKELLKQLSG